MPAAAAAAAANVPVIVVPPGGTLDVIVDVGPMAIPYTVAYAGKTLIKSLVDRADSERAALIAADDKRQLAIVSVLYKTATASPDCGRSYRVQRDANKKAKSVDEISA